MYKDKLIFFREWAMVIWKIETFFYILYDGMLPNSLRGTHLFSS